MTKNTEAFYRIEDYFEAFCSGIERIRSLPSPTPAELQDVYSRLGRLRDRYIWERDILNEREKRSLAKVFEDDRFTEGMMSIRQVAEHVAIKDFVICTPNNEPIPLEQGSSAVAVFEKPVVRLPRRGGEDMVELDHVKMFKEMEKRISAAIYRARD